MTEEERKIILQERRILDPNDILLRTSIKYGVLPEYSSSEELTSRTLWDIAKKHIHKRREEDRFYGVSDKIFKK